MELPATESLMPAEQSLNEGNYPSAIEKVFGYMQHHPNSYWAEFLLARIHQARQDTELMEVHLRRAIRTEDPAFIGAHFMLLHHQFGQRNLAEAHLIDRALVLAEYTDQNRWHRAGLYFLRALLELHHGRFGLADRLVRSAYDFDKSVTEMAFGFPWVIARLGEAPAHHAYLRYLRERYEQRPVIDYGEELRKLGADTHVLEIGAMDGKRFDPLHEHVVRNGWRAIMFEPTESMFAALQQTYRDYPLVNCHKLAVSDQSGTRTIYRMDPACIGQDEIGDWALGVSSLQLDTLRFYRDKLVQEQIRAVTFDKLVELLRIERLDVIQIDTEGHDYIIFKQIDLRRFGTKLIHLELLHVDPPQRTEVFQMLTASGYLYYFDGIDVTAVVA